MDRDFMLGDARIRPGERSIDIAGESRRIDHKAFQLLLCLVEQAGVPVSKRELLDRVWTQDFVTDDVLTVGISRLRRTLGDEARAPRFIETIPHVGYRLIAEVRELESTPESVAAEALGPSESAGRYRRSLAVVCALLLIGAVISGWGLLRSSRGPEQVQDVRTLMVLPLDNLTGDPAEGHLAEGMTEGLITGLAQQHVRVASRALVDRGTLEDLVQSLGVDAVVKGSVQRSQDRIRISLRMMAADTGRHLWATAVDGPVDRFFELQEALVGELLGQLRPDRAMTSPERTPTTVDPAAYESYLRGRYLVHQDAPDLSERLLAAVRHLETAIALAPDFADAYASLADAWLRLGEGSLVPPDTAFPKVREAAGELSRLRQHPAKAQALLAMVLFLYDWEFVAAEEAFSSAIDLDPDEILARDGYSRYLTIMGRFDEALEQQRILRDLNPLIYHQPYLAYILNMARRHPEALEELQKQLQIERRSARLYSHLTSTYRWLDRPEEGWRWFRIYLNLSGASDHQIEPFDRAFESSGVVGVAQQLALYFRQLADQGRWIPAMSHAEVLTLAGEQNAALAALRQAFLNREPDLLLIAQSPDYDSLRENPEFQEIYQQVFSGRGR